jgi:hypothetical protein
MATSNLIEIDLAEVAHRDNGSLRLWICESVSSIMIRILVILVPDTNIPPLLCWWHIHEQRFRIINADLQLQFIVCVPSHPCIDNESMEVFERGKMLDFILQ